MANDVELSDIVFKALIARRELLQRSTAALAVEIVGTDRSAAALALRTYAARQRLIHLWFDADTPEGRTMMESSGLTEDDLPAVVMPGATLPQATPGELADKLGLSDRRSSAKPVDVTIVGAGPAGLAAAVYGASEGLDTVLLDAVGTGGHSRRVRGRRRPLRLDEAGRRSHRGGRQRDRLGAQSYRHAGLAIAVLATAEC
jgi:thioredoxin reductase (NADPH)